MSVKNRIMILAALILVLACGAARAEYWTDDTHTVACVDNRTGCQMLQMVMMGSFAKLDLNDSLGTRVLSAVLPMLCGITERDFEHFCAYYGEDEATVRRLYYEAMGNCLLADMQFSQNAAEMKTAARRVLRLFLDPEAEADAQSQIDQIRVQMNEDMVEMIAEQAGVPEEFVAYLMGFEEEDDSDERYEDSPDDERHEAPAAAPRPVTSAAPVQEERPTWGESYEDSDNATWSEDDSDDDDGDDDDD